MKPCIVSHATRGREDYPSVMPRLQQSIRETDQPCDVLFNCPQSTAHNCDVSIPPFNTHPYAFKTYMIKAARERGYTQIVWCDSICYFVANVQPLLDIAAERGLVVADNPGCPIATWTSDHTLRALGADLEVARTTSQIMAGFQVWDFSVPAADILFDKMMHYCNDGLTLLGPGGSKRPDYRGHRHDQSVLSWLITEHKVDRIPYGQVCYWQDRQHFANATVCFRGIGQP